MLFAFITKIRGTGHLLNTSYWVPDNMLQALKTSPYLIFIITLWGTNADYSYFTEETKG